MEFMVMHDLVPVRTRWKRSASGVGRMFNDVFHIMDKNERAKLAEMMYSWGIEDANEIVGTLKIERNLHGCAIALMGMHRIFGIKSHVVEENANLIQIRATECLWINKKDWTPEVCAQLIDMNKDWLKVLIKIYCMSARKDEALAINSVSLC